MKFWTTERILKENADYNVIYGERSNGKTTGCQAYCLQEYINSGYKKQFALVRRWDEDMKGARGEDAFSGINSLGWIEKWTNGLYNRLKHNARRWYLVYVNEEGEEERKDDKPCCFGFAISQEEHYKSTSFPDIYNIIFDEFITRSYYLPDEFIKFQNLLSTIIRLKTDVKIFMCGNTVNRYCPYFEEMGLTNVKNQKKGTIDLYTYGDTTLRVAVEYSDFPTKQKKSNKYFAFNNPKLQMITQGSWEIDIYPHLPYKYTPKECKLIYYIDFNNELLECEIVHSREHKEWFTFIHRKTTPIRDDNERIVYSDKQSTKMNVSNDLFRPKNDIERKILWFYQNNKVCYQSNEVGEVVRNFILTLKNK